MKTKTSNTVIPVLFSTLPSKIFVFCEIIDPDEMEKLFRLRFKVYNSCEMDAFLATNEKGLDLDIYDLHSRHLGIFCGGELIAGVRAVFDKRDYYNPNVFRIGSKYGFYGEDVSSKEKLIRTDYSDFPFLSYPEVPKAVKQFYRV